MARKKASAGAKIVAILVEGAREFVTIGPDALAWCSPIPLDEPGKQIIEQTSQGSFVRLEPPSETSEEHVDRVKKICEMAGAAKVTVIRGRKAVALVAPKEKKPHRKGREVVMELVEESTFHDKEVLREFCECAMAKRSL